MIAVSAVDHDGGYSIYSEMGSNIWIASPGGYYSGRPGKIITTDLSGSSMGYNNSTSSGDLSNYDYTNNMNGTSSAAPIVSGVVALMLEANSNLTWRDVKYILATTARKNDPSEGTLGN